MSAGAMGAKHCGGSESAQHCDGKMGETSAVCLTHHASQEAHTQYGSSLDPDLSGSGEPVLGSNRIRKTTAHHRPFSGRPLHRGTLLRARIGVWLEWIGRRPPCWIADWVGDAPAAGPPAVSIWEPPSIPRCLFWDFCVSSVP